MVADRRTRLRRVLLGIAAVNAIVAFIIFYTHLGLMYYFNPMRGNSPDHVVILTTSWCPYCRALKKALTASKLPYNEIDVEQDWKTEYAFYATRQRGIPVTVIGKNIIDGGLSAQLAALKQVCERTNTDGKYDCNELKGLPAMRDGTSTKSQHAAEAISADATPLGNL
ncbi:MAG: glutaredoxin family protein [Gammaproteobacteria bacterium]